MSAIIANNPIVNDRPYFLSDGSMGGYFGSYFITNADFSSANPGLTSWFGAKAFASYLGSINYADSKEWTLPRLEQSLGYDQFSELFYSKLEGNAGNPMPKTSSFVNEQGLTYWSATEHELFSSYAWGFDTSNGGQGYSIKNGMHYVWAVSAGNIATIPIPAAIWLFGSVALGWLGSLLRIRR